MLAGMATGKLEGPPIVLYLPGAVLPGGFSRQCLTTDLNGSASLLSAFIGSVLICLWAYLYNGKHRVRKEPVSRHAASSCRC